MREAEPVAEPTAEPAELSVEDILGPAPKAPESTPSVDANAATAPAVDAAPSRPRLPGELHHRLRLVTSTYFDVDDWYGTGRMKRSFPDRGRISRQENRLELYLAYAPNRHIQLVGDIEPVFMGVAQADTLGDLASQRMLTPFHLESDAAYVAIHDALPGLDVKIGRQVLVWGTADKFNPTNNLNPDDLEDRPLFTEPIGNQMIVVDFSPLEDRLWFEAVYVPLFFPALLPPSAAAALEDPHSRPPFARESDVDKIAVAQDLMDANPCFATRVDSHVVHPQASVENGQAAGKIGTSVGQLDLSASYYWGRHDIPLPYAALTERVADCDPTSPPPDDIYFRTDAFLRYPRMHVAGLDFAAQIPFLANLGVWGEAGLIMPVNRHELRIELPIPLDVTPDDDTPNAVAEVLGPTVYKRPFLKATGGLDYTIGKHVYVNAQYVRGFINEFGAGNMGNYAVAGTDLIFFGRHLVFRLFGVAEFPDARSDQFAAALAPDIIVVPPWGYVTLELGGFALLGGRETNLGQRGAGSSIVYFKVAGQF